MPAISTGKVLVSGANGFIATWVVRTLLEQGFAVRGSVRSAEKCGHLRDIFAAYGEKFELVVVPDITQEGAFDEAVKGVDAIEHMASPVHLNAENPDEIIVPTVKGTLSMLNSAMKHGKNVKRVVLMSSTAAVLQEQSEPKTFSELDWNELVLQQIAEKGSTASGHTKYRAAKVLGERAAWEFFEQHKDKLGWDLVVLNPPYVFGPTIHAVSSPEALNLSTREFYKIFTQPSTQATLQAGNCWVDVRDLARAQVLTLLSASAGGERIIISAGPWIWQDWLDATPNSSKYQEGIPGTGTDTVYKIRFDASKSARLLGMTTYRSKGGDRAGYGGRLGSAGMVN
ncbi:NAD(P)-binding protein [Mycena venus]|uniref:NAD(P)-binding protein n=1 Tax=Mycena venus TaxID=2733690 RepID=A0A8H6TZI5_9AGAR|nr:NAD(P)-binding protein [Mycena venus]